MKNLGISLVIIGGLAVVIGVAGLAFSEDPATPGTEAIATTSTSGAITTVATQPTTTTLPATTTTGVPAETLDEFVSAFRSALDSDDAGFVTARLHPEVISAYGAELCRSWVEREILALEQYELTGEPTQPADQEIQTPGGSVAIEGMFTAPIRFTFQGQVFDSEASFDLIDGLVYWMGECR